MEKQSHQCTKSHVNRDAIHNSGIILKMQGLDIIIQNTRHANIEIEVLNFQSKTKQNFKN